MNGEMFGIPSQSFNRVVYQQMWWLGTFISWLFWGKHPWKLKGWNVTNHPKLKSGKSSESEPNLNEFWVENVVSWGVGGRLPRKSTYPPKRSRFNRKGTGDFVEFLRVCLYQFVQFSWVYLPDSFSYPFLGVPRHCIWKQKNTWGSLEVQQMEVLGCNPNI